MPEPERTDWYRAVFIECDTCRALPGSPALCRGCLHNRRALAFLQSEYRDLANRVASVEGSRIDGEGSTGWWLADAEKPAR